jgi:peptidyl-prolyl cis-trans isomerase C
MLRASALALLTLAVVAQEPAKTTSKSAKSAPKAKTTKTAKSSEPPVDKSPVLARVGDERITEADFQSAFSLLGQQEQMQIMMIQGGKDEFIKRMAESKLLAVKAKRLGLDKTATFAIALSRAKDDLLAREFLTKESDALQQKLVTSDAEVKAYYDKHPDRFKQPDLVSVRHILVSVKQDPKAETGLSDEAAQARIAKIQEELKGGAKFEDLAKTYSDDPGSKDNGGLYADADPSSWVPEFGAAAKNQPIGEVGAAVKTKFGYHLVKVESRKPARQIPFEEAKASAEQQARRERQAAVWDELMDSLRKEIPFEMVKAPAPKAAPAPVQPAAPTKPETAPEGGSK